MVTRPAEIDRLIRQPRLRHSQTSRHFSGLLPSLVDAVLPVQFQSAEQQKRRHRKGHVDPDLLLLWCVRMTINAVRIAHRLVQQLVDIGRKGRLVRLGQCAIPPQEGRAVAADAIVGKVAPEIANGESELKRWINEGMTAVEIVKRGGYF